MCSLQRIDANEVPMEKTRRVTDHSGPAGSEVRNGYVVLDRRRIRSLALSMLWEAARPVLWFVLLWLAMFPALLFAVWSSITAATSGARSLALVAIIGAVFVSSAGVVLISRQLRRMLRHFKEHGLVGSPIRAEFRDEEVSYVGLSKAQQLRYDEIRSVSKYPGWYFITSNSGAQLAIPTALISRDSRKRLSRRL